MSNSDLSAWVAMIVGWLCILSCLMAAIWDKVDRK